MKSYIGLISEEKAKERNIPYKETEFAGIVKYRYYIPDGDDSELGWSAAEKRTFDSTVIATLGEILGVSPAPTVYVVTNEKRFLGASAILDKESLRNKVPKGKYVMLPSSIHEVLLYPNDGSDMEKFVDMVKTVNATEVDPDDQLANTAYEIIID